MDVWVDLLDATGRDEDETDDSAYEPGWYSVLKELAHASATGETQRRV
jgi:hypothetical protein